MLFELSKCSDCNDDFDTDVRVLLLVIAFRESEFRFIGKLDFVLFL